MGRGYEEKTANFKGFKGIRLTDMLLKRLSMGELHLLAIVFDENVMSYESN